jgi:hypothetical protein
LEAAIEIAKILGKQKTQKRWAVLLEKGKERNK